MNSKQTALIIGNSSGIGLAITKRLLSSSYKVHGISKSPSPIVSSNYQHLLMDVTDPDFESALSRQVNTLEKIDVCIYCAGIGDIIDFNKLSYESSVFKVNLMSAVIATNVLVTKMKAYGSGHFIGLSSIADRLTSSETPSYCASKAGVSRYWESLGLALKKHNIHISNVRFGFVDTKMAKAPTKPMMIDVETAAKFIEEIIAKPRIRATKPLLMDALLSLLAFIERLRFIGR